MLSVAVAALLWVPALVGLGSLVGYGGDPALRRVVDGLLGLAVAGVAATVLHFVVPIGPAVSLVLWAAGIGAAFARRRLLAEGTSAAELGGAALALALLPSAIQDPAALYDSGLYYAQTILWTTEHPLRLGLANLHDRLGFNSLWHVIAAALELPLLHGRAQAFVNVLPVLFTAAAGGVGIRRVLARRPRFADLALALALPVAAHATGGIGAASPDQAAMVLVYLSAALWIRALEGDDATFAAEGRGASLLGLVAVAVKPSAAPVLAAAAAAVLLRRRALPRRWWAEVALLGLALLVPWTVRSVLLSGCAVFPAPSTCAPGLPWAIPREAAEAQATWIRSWARTPGADPREVLASSAWLPGWAARMARRGDLRFFAATTAVGLTLWASAPRRLSASVLVPVAAAALGVAYVFVAAPDPRFAFGFLHVLALVPLAFGLSHVGALSHRAAGAVLAAAIVVASARWVNIAHIRTPWRPGPIALPDVPSVATEERVTRAGVRVRIPVQGDQCWAAPLPCAPADPELLREDGRIYSTAR